jgi:hypothetical protein
MANFSHSELFSALEYSAKALGASQEDIFEFARCMRPNGTFYGTRGRCKSGTEAGPADRKETAGRGEEGTKDKYLENRQKDLESAQKKEEKIQKTRLKLGVREGLLQGDVGRMDRGSSPENKNVRAELARVQSAMRKLDTIKDKNDKNREILEKDVTKYIKRNEKRLENLSDQIRMGGKDATGDQVKAMNTLVDRVLEAKKMLKVGPNRPFGR